MSSSTRALSARLAAAASRTLREPEREEPFMIVDLDDALGKVEAWRKLLPRVEPFFAVKAHDDARIVKAFLEAGVGFDCASKAEIEIVMQQGAAPQDIIFANPCKARSHIRFARERGVRLMTFDNEDELYKFHEVFPDAELVLRLLPDDSKAVCRLGTKFGAELSSVAPLLRTATDLGLRVVGMAFHVGSGQPDVRAFSSAVELARAAFDIAAEQGLALELLDIGGGFPGDAVESWGGFEEGEMCFRNVAAALSEALDEHFPAESGVRIIAEPGRFMVHSACTLFVNIIARRREPRVLDAATGQQDRGTADPSAEEIRYYVNDGVYGSFNNILYDHAQVCGYPLPRDLIEQGAKSEDAGEQPAMNLSVPSDSGEEGEVDEGADPAAAARPARPVLASVWGPTCDGLDCILPRATHLPLLRVGEWLYFPDMGAYTLAASSTFNGFPVTDKVHLEPSSS